VGLVAAPPPGPVPGEKVAPAGLGLAMIFVLLTYGGWNEAAYIAGEVRDPQRNMRRILVGGILLITVLYLVVNLAYFSALGLHGMRDSQAVAAELMRRVGGRGAAAAISVVVCVAALTTMNAAIITGARTSYAFGRDVPALAFLGRWREAGSTPANALLVQGARPSVHGASYVTRLDGAVRKVSFANTEPYQSKQWYLRQDRAWEFWPAPPSLRGVKVAVIDSGIDLDIALPNSRACYSDDIKDALDYAEVAQHLQTVLSEGHFSLMETLAEHIAQIILKDFNAPWVKVSVAKLQAIRNCKMVGISIERGQVK